MDKIWVAYKGSWQGQRDESFIFNELVWFEDELTCLRYATKNGCKALELPIATKMAEAARLTPVQDIRNSRVVQPR